MQEVGGDEDNILAQLLPGNAGALSSQGFVEEDEEEVKYSDTDDDIQLDDPSSARRRVELTHSGHAQDARWALLQLQHSLRLANSWQREAVWCQTAEIGM